MDNNPSVLIVGAGPTGLMMACKLAQYGISFRIIDKKPEASKQTNAAVLHKRSLEILDQMGIVDRFLKEGNRATELRMHGERAMIATIPLDHGDCYYKFALMLPQYKTEKLLNDYLEENHRRIERSVELIDLKQEGSEVYSTLKYANGNTEVVKSQWVIGCDGIGSTIREKSSISFGGEDFPQEFLVADICLETSLSVQGIDGFLGQKIMGIFPLGEDRYRVVANMGKTTQTISEPDIRQMVENRTQGQFKVKSISWSSPFWIHSKFAENMRNGPCFIAGDAAHVHSPAGGQGMNTGLQDVHNLAWKLALVIHGKAEESILDSYHLERHPVIEGVVNFTEKMTKLGTINNRFFSKLREIFMRFILNSSYTLEMKIGTIVSQLAIRYKQSPIIHYRPEFSSGAPPPGGRAPDALLGDSSEHLYAHFRNNQHNLLLFTGTHPSEEDIRKILGIQKWVQEHCRDMIQTHAITQTHHPEFNNEILDQKAAVHQSYQITQPALCLIRPDLYIALFINELSQESLVNFLQTKSGLKI